MRSLFRLATFFAAIGGLSSCIAPEASSLRETARLATLYVAISESEKVESPVLFEVAAPAQATGVILCPGNVLENCRRGQGEIRTLDHRRDLASGARIFRTNLTWVPQQAGDLTVVAHDAAGQVLGANVIRMERR